MADNNPSSERTSIAQPDKAELSDWLGQNWKGEFKPTEVPEKKPHHHKIKSKTGFEDESSELDTETDTLTDTYQVKSGTGSGIVLPSLDLNRRNTFVANVKNKPHRIKHKPKHHLHQHLHTEVVLEELPYVENSEFLIIRSYMDSKEKSFPHFAGTSRYTRYQVWDRNRTQLYTGVELGSFLCQFLLGPSRSFQLNLYGPDGDLNVVIRRPGNCLLWFFGGHYFANGATVEDQHGNPLGAVKQTWFSSKPTYSILDDTGTSQLFAQGTTKNPIHILFQRIHFNLFTAKGSQNVGLFTRHHWQQILTPRKRDTEEGPSFGVVYPGDMDETMRIPVMAAAFLLSISYFEHKTGGIAGIDMFFYLFLAGAAAYIIYLYCLDAFYATEYVPWCQRPRFNDCRNLNSSKKMPANLTTIAPAV